MKKRDRKKLKLCKTLRTYSFSVTAAGIVALPILKKTNIVVSETADYLCQFGIAVVLILGIGSAYIYSNMITAKKENIKIKQKALNRKTR